MYAPDQNSQDNPQLLRSSSLNIATPAAQAVVDGRIEGLQVDFEKLLRKYFLLAALLMMVGGTAGFFSVVVTAPAYQSKALVEVQPMSGSVLKMQTTQDYTSGNDVDLLTESRILLSNTFLRGVLQRIQLGNVSATPAQAGIFGTLRRILKLNVSSEIPVALRGDGLNPGDTPKAVAMAIVSLKAEPVNGTHLIEISCESTSPQFAADFLNAVTDEYIDHNYKTRMEMVRSTTLWISGQLEEAKAKMMESEQKLQEFLRNSGDAFATQKNTLAESKLQDIQARLAAAQSDLISRQALYELVHKTPSESLPNVIDDPTVRQYQVHLADLRREEANLLVKYTPENPKVQGIEAQITNLQATQQKELNAAVKRIDSQYETAKRDQELLRSAYAATAQQVASQTSTEAQYNALKKEGESAREAYQSLLLQANQASIAGSLPVNNIQPIDRAVPPEKPYKPKPLVNIGMGTLAGLAMSCGLAFLRERMDQRVRSPGHARQLFNLPQLGVIPSAEQAPSLWQSLPGPVRGRLAQSETDMVAAITNNDGSVGHFVSSDHTLLAESFRVTLASIMRDSENLRRPQVLLVTSPGPEEGKTTIATNLGIALAETGRRVLILDADFRRPRAHKVFGVANTNGLANLLADDSPVNKYSRESLGVKTPVPNLFILPNGSQSQNIAKLLYSPRLRDLIERLRYEFEMVLIDAPPMLHLADARVISGIVDSTILVIRSDVTDKDSVMEVLEQLQADRVNILGTVLNDWKPTKAQAKKSHYYSTFDSYDRT